jgi:hypothetical protein
MRPEINLWRTGNKLQRALAAHALARIPRRNYTIFTRRRRTQWLLNWRAISNRQQNAEAAKWYTTAAARFRRAD